MKNLLGSLEKLKNSKAKASVDARLREFKKLGEGSSSEIFEELCFCILTANTSAEKCMQVQMKVGEQFLTLSQFNLAKRLKELGYRFPNVRARYIVDARKHRNWLNRAISTSSDENELREWLVKNIKGIGPKEASHFLRNIGYTNLAIIDFHIINILSKYKIIAKLKVLTKRRYLEIEDLLRNIARESNLNLAELDLYLWFMETGKILK